MEKRREPSPLLSQKTRCKTRKERDFNEKPKPRKPKCKLSTPPSEGHPEPRVCPSPPLRPPAEAQGLELLPQVALELRQASL